MYLFRTLLITSIFLVGSYSGLSQELKNSNSKEVELVIDHDQVTIGGTLLIPDQPSTSALVIFSSGSGPQDRDETLFDFKIFKLIAEHLASHGIPSFRYDDRGVGKSTGDFVNSTIDDLTGDVDAIIEFFKNDDANSYQEFILFGHSQGGIIAGKAAVINKSVKQLILMASPSVPLVEVVLAQVRASHDPIEVNPRLIEAEVSSHAELMSSIKMDQGIDKALDEFKMNYRLILAHSNSTDDQEIDAQVDRMASELRTVYGLPSLASFLYYDPVNDLEQLEIPVLGLFGGNDTQVSIQQNKDRMEGALLKGGSNYHFEVFDSANHFFQKADTGNREEYEKLEKRFVSDFLKDLTSWIRSY